MLVAACCRSCPILWAADICVHSTEFQLILHPVPDSDGDLFPSLCEQLYTGIPELVSEGMGHGGLTSTNQFAK